MRRFAIGDIHGCGKALRSLIEEISPNQEDELVFLGDYVDRGPDSKDVVDQIVSLQDQCQVVALRGNHEIMFMGVALRGLDDQVWRANGGNATVTSYGGSLSKIPAQHYSFFQELLPYYETATSIFVHAGYHPLLKMHEQEDVTLYWSHLGYPLPGPHHSGKRVFIGHTPQGNGNVLDGGHIVCIDTYCFGGRYLTAFNVDTDEVIQVDYHGHVRRPSVLAMNGPLSKLASKFKSFVQSRFTSSTEAKQPTETVDLAPADSE